MKSIEIRELFLDFFKKKNHKILPSAPLVLRDDPSVFFTTAGMQPLKSYFSGFLDPKKDFGTTDLCSIQKCLRTSDIDDVGDESHLTFFEMLGNFSVGGYGKKEAIKLAHEFLIEKLKLEKSNILVTVFAGDKDIPEDHEAYQIWQKIDSNLRIEKRDKKENFWGPTGLFGPCGPSSEILWVENGLEIELWNLVFTQFYLDEKGKLSDLGKVNIDTGMGLERLAKVLPQTPSVFETDLFSPIIKEIRVIAKESNVRSERIIADHLKAGTFIMADDVSPSNVKQGYILRRLIRRAIRHGRILGVKSPWTEKVIRVVIDEFAKSYKELSQKEKIILKTFKEEEEKFAGTLDRGLKELEKLGPKIDEREAFFLYETYGFPFELTQELAKEKGAKLNPQKFEEEVKKHQDISKKGAGFYASGLVEINEKTTKMHTATHLLHQALRDVLGKHVFQTGSHITNERLRFDFTHGKSLNEKEIEAVEKIVNQKIKENLPVRQEKMALEKARKIGAVGLFGEKYPENEVSVFLIGDYSKEFCLGPHAQTSGELGKFKIFKEEGIGQGVRRVYAKIG